MVQPRQALAAVVVTFALGGLGSALWSNWEGARAFDWGESGGAFVGASVLFAAAPLVQSACFVLALRGLGARAPWLDTTVIWTRSFLLRYAPTGAVGYVYRLRRKGRLGADASVLIKATGLEQLSAVAAGAVVGLGALAVSGTLAPAFLARGRLPARLLVLNLAGWLPTGLATWLLVSHLAPDAEVSPVWLAGAYATAWLAGVLVPFAPGGFGIREAVLAGVLVEPIGGVAAVTVALALRLASTVGELIAVGAVEVAWHLRGPR